jgi:hypothetical protein
LRGCDHLHVGVAPQNNSNHTVPQGKSMTIAA